MGAGEVFMGMEQYPSLEVLISVGVVVWGCKKSSLKMLERCKITLSSWAKPLQGGWAGFSSPSLGRG